MSHLTFGNMYQTASATVLDSVRPLHADYCDTECQSLAYRGKIAIYEVEDRRCYRYECVKAHVGPDGNLSEQLAI